MSAGLCANEWRGWIGQDDDRKLQAFGLMHRHHPDAFSALLDDGRFAEVVALGIGFHAFNECPERACVRLEATREVNDPRAIGERLLASCPKRDASMSAHALKQHRDRLRNGPVIAPCMKLCQQIESVCNFLRILIKLFPIDRMHRVQPPRTQSAVGIHILPVGEKCVVTKGKEGSPQRGKDPELVIGPLDGRERIAKRDDLFPGMEGTTTDQDMRNAPRLKSTNIGPGDVGEVRCAIDERGCRYGVG